jgi:hypothetical protein
VRAHETEGDIAYPSFFHHIFHLLHSGIMIVPGKIKQDAKRRDLAAPTRASGEISHCQCHAAPCNSLSRFELGKATWESDISSET